MAYTTITPWISGNVPTAAQLNALRDNLASLRNGNEQYCKLYLDDDVTIANNTAANLTWTDADFQVGTIWNAVTNPSRLTAPVTGIYLVLINIEWRTNNTGNRGISIVRSAGGATTYELQNQGAPQNRTNTSAALVVDLTAAQYLTVRVLQNSGGNLDLHGGTRDRSRVAMMLWGV